MLSEGIKGRQQRIEEFQEKIDKVMNDIFITVLDQILDLRFLNMC